MAGAGWKLWVSGERVNNDEFQEFLQDQVIAVFTSTTSRDNAITSPAEGQLALTTTDDQLWIYSGATWTPFGRYSGAATWTPTVSQGASSDITKTVNEARYVRIGNLVHAWCHVTITGSGSAGSPVLISLPVTPSGHPQNSSIGSGQCNDADTIANSVVVNVWYNSGATVYFQAAAVTAAGRWGQMPSVALANGDSIRFNVSYLVA